MAANTPSKYLIGSVITFFCLYLLVQIILSSALSLGKNTMPRENTPKVAVSDRIKPIGEVYISGAPVLVEQTIEIAKDISPGEKIVTAVCLRCHGVGLMRSPKIGKTRDWAPRIKKGTATLYANAINGINKMPPRGGKKNLSDDDVKAAVNHMLSLAN